MQPPRDMVVFREGGPYVSGNRVGGSAGVRGAPGRIAHHTCPGPITPERHRERDACDALTVTLGSDWARAGVVSDAARSTAHACRTAHPVPGNIWSPFAEDHHVPGRLHPPPPAARLSG